MSEQIAALSRQLYEQHRALQEPLKADGGTVRVETAEGTDEFIITRRNSRRLGGNGMMAPVLIPGGYTADVIVKAGEITKELAQVLGLSEAEAEVPSIGLPEDEPKPAKELKYGRKLEP